MVHTINADMVLLWLYGPDGEREWDSDTLPELAELIRNGYFDAGY